MKILTTDGYEVEPTELTKLDPNQVVLIHGLEMKPKKIGAKDADRLLNHFNSVTAKQIAITRKVKKSYQ